MFPGDPGFHGHRQILLVQGNDPVQAGEVENDPPVDWYGSPQTPGSPSSGNHRHLFFCRQFHNSRNFLRVQRIAQKLLDLKDVLRRINQNGITI